MWKNTKLNRDGKLLTNEKEMRLFLGIIFSVTKAPKKGVFVSEFNVCSDGIIPASDLEIFGLKHWRFKKLFSHWIYDTLDDGDNAYQPYPYWETNQMVQHFNDHYRNNFEHGSNVTVDEGVFSVWACDQPGLGHKVDIKQRGFGPEYKYISAVGFLVTTTFEHVRSKEVNDKNKCTKEHGTGSASVLRLCKATGIEGRNPDVIANCWFVDIKCVLGQSKLGL